MTSEKPRLAPSSAPASPRSERGQWLRQLRAALAAPVDPPLPQQLTPAQRHRDERARATTLWESGKYDESLDVLRGALLVSPDAVSWYVYGARMMQRDKPDVAFEALKNALDLDHANVPALELFLELCQRPDKPLTRPIRAALSRFATAVPGRPLTHRDALGFFIPARQSEGLAALAESPDPAVRLAVRLNGTPRGEWPDVVAEAAPAVARDAQVLCLLGRGGASQAADILGTMPDEDLPVLAIRLALRRVLRGGHHTRAQALLRHYLRVRPDDSWAKAKVIEARSGDLANFRLITEGFPVGEPAAEPAYAPSAGRVFYTLHNSLPYHSAGYATRTHGLLRALHRTGWDVSGVTRLGYPYDMPGHADDGVIPAVDHVDDVPYQRLSTEPGIERKSPIQAYVRRYGTALEELARRERPFVLHGASNHWNGLAAVSTARRLGLPSIYEVRGLWEVTRGSRDPIWAQGETYQFMSRMEADAARGATKVIAITGALRDELVRRGVDGDKIMLVPNGVDTDRFVPRPRNEELARRLGVTGKTVIGYVGSVLDYEGLGLLVDAAAALSLERSNFVVLVVGDGNEREALEGRVARDGLDDIIRFVGRVPHEEVEDYYSIIDICPFPRLPLPVCEMVSPLKPFEALAMGKAVVASDVAALAEIVQDGVNGLLHVKGDTASLAEQLRRLLDDADLRRRLSSDGREWVVRHRRWDVLSSRITELYEELGGSRSEAVAV